MPRIARHLFAGPSLRFYKGVEDLNVSIHGPIQHGDLIRLGLTASDVVGIVDGVFYDQPAIRPLEIATIAEEGVVIFGGASMGAIRAADLRGHGIVGVGWVYQWLRHGGADHEVALSHGDQESGYRPFSIASVSVRHALAGLVRDGGASATQAQDLIDEFSVIHFADRTQQELRSIGVRVGLSHAITEQLLEIVTGPKDVKTRDAAHVLTAVVSPGDRGRTSDGPVRFSRQQTDSYAGWIRELALETAPTSELAFARAVQAVQLFSGRGEELYEGAVRRKLSSEWGVPEDRVAIGEEFRRRTGLPSVSAELADWWLYPPPTDEADFLYRLAIVTYRVNPALTGWKTLASYLRDKTDFDSVARALQSISRKDWPAGQAEYLGQRAVVEWLSDLWKCPNDLDVLRRIAYARGFRDAAEAYRVAIKCLGLGLDRAQAAASLGDLK